MSGNPYLEDAFWAAQFPDEPPTFDMILARVKLGMKMLDEPPEDFQPKAKVTAHQRALMEKCVVLSERLHAKGRTLEALGYLFLPLEIVAFHKGTGHAEFDAIEKYARKFAAQDAGRHGAKTKAEAVRIRNDLIAADLLKIHAKTPFTHKRDMLRAATARGPNKGEEDSDEAWARRLLKRPDLAEIYETLAAPRASPTHRVTR